LSLIIRRIATLLSQQGSLIAQNEAALKQATSASDTARRLMDENSDKSKKSGAGDAAYKDRFEIMQAKVTSLMEELDTVKKDRDAIKSQAESVGKEYDRLMDEHNKLERQINIQGDKKGD